MEQSLPLIRWSDVVIVYASSIALDALAMNKPVIYPEFVDTNRTVLSEYGASWDFSTVDDLVDAMEEFRLERMAPTRLKKGVSRYLETVVYAESVDVSSVAARYFDFIDNRLVSV